jgi:UDP:flavonoid glycosyltransferase YjiC (YdhE family)
MRNRKTKILFFPWSHGVGFGYIGRALTIAEALRNAGYTCVFGCDTAEGIIARCGMRVCLANRAHGTAVPDMGDRRGDYIPLDNLDTVYAIARYYHASRIWEHLNQDLEVINAVAPDVIVVDMQPTAAIAARLRGIPILSVADSDFLRSDPNSWMPWLTPEQACVLPYPSCLSAFNRVLSDLSLSPIQHVSDLLWGDLTLLASTPELEANQPVLIERGPLEYVGPIFWDPPWSDVKDILSVHGADSERRIYVTLGHGGKVSHRDFNIILEGCNHHAWSVFVSLGFRPPEKKLRLPPNAVLGGFTGISEPICWSDVVINHGGYATVLAGLLYGKPAIVLPFMSEQEANGILFVEKLGAGFVLRKTIPARKSNRHFEYRLRYSGFSADGAFEPNEVRQALNEIFSDGRYTERAGAFGNTLRERVRNRCFAQMIERIL